MSISLRRYSRNQFDDISDVLVDVYAEVYESHLSIPFYSRARFQERLKSHISGKSWEAVIGWEELDPVGYVYGSHLDPGARWWSGLDDVSQKILASPGLAIFELMVRTPWRGTGAAKKIHDSLLSGRDRSEKWVSLAVKHDHSRVRAMYERWGYQHVGSLHPFPDAPLLDIMLMEIWKS